MHQSKSHVTIEYCVLCQWLLRAGWMAQEVLSTFSTDLEQVSLKPASKGVFKIYIDDQIIWDRQIDGGFPEAKVLKQKIRDVIQPGRDLGHIDN